MPARALVLFLVLFGLFFLVLWHIKDWKYSVIKTIFFASMCSLVSTGLAAGIIFLLVLMG